MGEIDVDSHGVSAGIATGVSAAVSVAPVAGPIVIASIAVPTVVAPVATPIPIPVPISIATAGAAAWAAVLYASQQVVATLVLTQRGPINQIVECLGILYRDASNDRLDDDSPTGLIEAISGEAIS